MPLPPQPRQRTPHAAGNHVLDKGDQIVTKVDKTCQRQPPPQPQTPAKHSNTANPAAPSTPLSTLAVNPSGASRTTLNRSEQIRTPSSHARGVAPPT